MYYVTLLCLFALVPELKSGSTLTDDCAKLELNYLLSEVAGKQEQRIELEARGGKQPYYYIFFDNNNNPLTWDFKQSHCIASKSKMPKYAKVVDANGCVTTIYFNERADR